MPPTPAPTGAGSRLRLRGWVALAGVLAFLTLPVSSAGVAQLATTIRDQLGGPAEVTDFLAYYSGAQVLLRDPTQLYDPAAQQALERELQVGGAAYVPFVSPPQVPLILAPLGLLPFGLAYVVWGALALACLGLAAYLLAPRLGGRGSWLAWLVVAPLFMPVLLGLVMGQSSCLMLLGFCAFARLLIDGRHLAGGLALVAWSWKPNMLPAYVAALVAARRWRTLSVLGTACLALLGAGLLVIGPDGLRDFMRVSMARFGVATLRPDGYPEGFTFLTIAQGTLGSGLPAMVLALLAGAGAYGAVCAMWWRGLCSDARRYLQLAVLPIAATLGSLHAGVYDLTT